ncbi:transaldolase/EF-hand domain-containing protein [Symmachiella dynata]|uniref:hypothetical protein n=1 Tax=Symmachiella dynata TaxID=2527995 RepID=UPI00118AE1E6|nr:hypothetical protein [Symmachiella dynata]QDT49051.1 transaldolase/EF-hand domain-containing protein [Symmachiella dynata]
MFRYSIFLAIATIGGDAVSSDSRAADVDFLLVGDRGTIERIAIPVEINGKPLSTIWDDAFAELFAYYDDDQNGELTFKEAMRLPSPFNLRQTLWNPISQFGHGYHSPMDLDTNSDGSITQIEMTDWYRKRGVGGVTISAGLAPSSTALTSAIFKILDHDNNRRISTTEWKNAPTVLSALDVNADETITPEEILPRLNYPGTSGAYRWDVKKSRADQHTVIRELPLRFLPQSMDVDHSFQADQLEKDEVQVHAQTMKVNFSKSFTSMTMRIDADRVRVLLRSDEGKLGEHLEAAAQKLRTRFQSADVNNDSCLNTAETERKNQADLRALVAVADHNRDGQLTIEELDRWIVLQEKLAAGQVLVTVLDFRRGLFEILDTNADGRLSLREIASSAKNVQEIHRQPPDTFVHADVPRQIRMIFSRGRPQKLLAAVKYDAPEWFLAMDRNRDGDISSREFIGDEPAFQRLDRNGDLLISPDEINKR